MPQDLQGLIEKIQKEGIKTAEDKANSIELEAREEAKKIIAQAQAKAKELIAQAQQQIAQKESNTRQLLGQASRDVLLELRKQILSMLENLAGNRVREALTAKEISEIIQHLIKNYSKKDDGEIIIYLKHDDLERLKKDLFAHLAEDAKKSICLRASDEISGGFIISYDCGKSHFDFTDKALAEYIIKSLKPKLGEILKDIS